MNKNLMIGLGVLAVAGIAYYMYKKPKATSNVSTKSGETSSNARGFAASMGKVPSRIKGGGTSQAGKGYWVSSIEDGNDYCRWYDDNGVNTVTYNLPCTAAQANM